MKSKKAISSQFGWVGNSLASFLVLAFLSQLTACSVDKKMTTTGSESTPEASQTSVNQTAVKPAEEPESLKQIDIDIPKEDLKNDTLSSVTFKNAEHAIAFKMMHNKDGGAIIDDTGKVKFSFVEDHKEKARRLIRVKDGKGAVIGVVSVVGVDLIELADANKYKQYALKFDGERVFKLKDAENNVLYKIKDESYGVKIETADGTVAGKVKVKEEKVTLKNASNELVLSTRSEVPAPALACFAMDKLGEKEKYSLAYSLMFLRL